MLEVLVLRSLCYWGRNDSTFIEIPYLIGILILVVPQEPDPPCL